MDKKQKKSFPPGYFDKPEEKAWYVKLALPIGISFFVVICTIVAIFLGPSGCTTDNKPIVDTLVTDTLNRDSITPIIVKDSLSSDTANIKPSKSLGDKDEKAVSENKEINNNSNTKNHDEVSNDIEKEVLSVIRGNYGNNPERRQRLQERYQDIQDRVNEMYRNGLVH